MQRWYAARVPEHTRHQARVECQVAGNTSIEAMPEGSATVTMASEARQPCETPKGGRVMAETTGLDAAGADSDRAAPPLAAISMVKPGNVRPTGIRTVYRRNQHHHGGASCASIV